MTFELSETEPPKNNPLVDEEAAATYPLATVRSPKSAALPAVAKVIYCISFSTPPESVPPPITPLVALERPPGPLFPVDKFPKSAALPLVAMK